MISLSVFLLTPADNQREAGHSRHSNRCVWFVDGLIQGLGSQGDESEADTRTLCAHACTRTGLDAALISAGRGGGGR